jgi:hypothetical protein
MRFSFHPWYCACALLLLPGVNVAQSRERVEQETLREGLALYQSERASWVATDIYLASVVDRSELSGYLSYAVGDSVRTVFFGHGAPNSGTSAPPVLADFTFPQNDIQLETSRRGRNRSASAEEQRLFGLRQQVIGELKTGKLLGEPYRVPAQCNLNVVVLGGDAPRAYLIAGPKESGVVPIGNDYLLAFNKQDRLNRAEKLHNSYLPFRVDPKIGNVESGMHTHLPAHPYITATDICSLLLYRHVFPVAQHLVIGPKDVSILSMEPTRLSIIDKKVFERINKQSQKGFKK